MTAARIALRQERAEPAKRRDPIGWLLLYRIEDTDKHPGLMLTIVAALIVLQGVVEQWL